MWGTNGDRRALAQPTCPQELVHHERCLERRRRTLEGRPQDPDDDVAAGEVGDNRSGPLRAGYRVELLTGVPTYSKVDPEDLNVTVLELVDGRYVERAVVWDEDTHEALVPFAVPITPARLVDDLT